jgi:hypothetical protein
MSMPVVGAGYKTSVGARLLGKSRPAEHCRALSLIS